VAPTPDELWAAFTEQANTYKPALRRAFLRVIALARTGLDQAELEHANQHGNIAGATELILGPGEIWAELQHAVRYAVTKATGFFSAQIAVHNTPVARVVFGVQNPKALEALRTAQLSLIREVDQKTREGIRAYLTDSLNAGRNPRSVIRQLAGTVQEDGSRKGGIIGLTERQARAVSNYRKYLEGNDTRALERALRDKRFDKTVARAISGGESLDPGYITKLVYRYEANYLAYRAEVIARSESMKALQLGQRMAWDEAISQGSADSGALTKRWVTAKDERVRPTHADMEGVTVGYDEDFDPEDTGPIWAPPAAPQCRCIAWIRPTVEQVINL
jgi:hypothetical protein